MFQRFVNTGYLQTGGATENESVTSLKQLLKGIMENEENMLAVNTYLEELNKMDSEAIKAELSAGVEPLSSETETKEEEAGPKVVTLEKPGEASTDVGYMDVAKNPEAAGRKVVDLEQSGDSSTDVAAEEAAARKAAEEEEAARQAAVEEEAAGPKVVNLQEPGETSTDVAAEAPEGAPNPVITLEKPGETSTDELKEAERLEGARKAAEEAARQAEEERLAKEAAEEAAKKAAEDEAARLKAAEEAAMRRENYRQTQKNIKAEKMREEIQSEMEEANLPVNKINNIVAYEEAEDTKDKNYLQIVDEPKTEEEEKQERNDFAKQTGIEISSDFTGGSKKRRSTKRRSNKKRSGKKTAKKIRRF